MSQRAILVVVLVVLFLFVLPVWPYAHTWGYVPAGGLGTIVVVLVVLLLLGVI